jgi:hypothetical protein
MGSWMDCFETARHHRPARLAAISAIAVIAVIAAAATAVAAHGGLRDRRGRTENTEGSGHGKCDESLSVHGLLLLLAIRLPRSLGGT